MDIIPVIVKWRHVGFFKVFIDAAIVYADASEFHVCGRLNNRLSGTQKKCIDSFAVSRSKLLTYYSKITVTAISYKDT